MSLNPRASVPGVQAGYGLPNTGSPRKWRRFAERRSDYDYRRSSDLVIGTVNEDFAIESLQGDIFQLGNTSWRVLRVEQGKVRVEDAHGQPPSIPFWLGEAPARSHELSVSVSRLREEVAARIDTENPDLGSAVEWVVEEVGRVARSRDVVERGKAVRRRSARELVAHVALDPFHQFCVHDPRVSATRATPSNSRRRSYKLTRIRKRVRRGWGRSGGHDTVGIGGCHDRVVG